MKVIIVGASGRIGTAIAGVLSASHEIISVGMTSGEVQCDYTGEDSVRSMFEQVGQFDSLVSVAGRDTVFKPYGDLSDEDYKYGFERKFLGQIRLVRLGVETISDNGSFTLTSGFLSHYPNPSSIATGPLNAAVETFVEHTAPLLPHGVRLNVVSPAHIVEPDQETKELVTAMAVADYYVNAVEGSMTGQVLRAWGGLPIPR